MRSIVILCSVGFAGAVMLKGDMRAAPGSISEASDWPLPILEPKEHSYLSTNAKGTANFMLRYFDNTKLLQDESIDSSKKKVRVVEYCGRSAGCIKMRFIEDAVAPDTSIPQKDFVKVSDDDMRRAGSNARKGIIDYSPWIDFHDGITSDGFKVDLAIKDKLMFQKYTYGPVRISLPYTTWTLELVGGYTTENHAKLNSYAGIDQPEKCRTNENCLDNIAPIKFPATWYKITYSTPDPAAAADFAVHALGGIRKVNPFVDLGSKDCTVVEWVVLPNRLDHGVTEKQAAIPVAPVHDCTILDKHGKNISGMNLHFVNNPSYPSSKTVADLVKQQELLRDLDAEAFNQYMQNHVEFQVASLDPFIARFQKLGLQFIARKSDHSFSVYVDVPKNSLVFKISSSKAPTLVDVQSVDEA